MRTLNNKNNIPSARTSNKKLEPKSISSRANEKSSNEIKKSIRSNN